MSEMTNDDQVFNNMRTVGSLCNEKCNFLVPAYQRGYRWTPDQVKDLLNDIDENMKMNKEYCLQPLVIKKQVENEQVIYELIDGQQRLTTIFLILCALSDAEFGRQKSFILSFDRTVNYKFLESGDEKLIKFQEKIKKDATFFDALRNVVGQKHILAFGGEEDIQKNFNLFWKELQAKDGYDNIDRVYLLQALNTIIDYYYDDQGKYRRNDGNGETDLISHIKNKFYFLWYETEDTAETAFSRLNSGKISLNNADLIKALLLRRENLMTDDIKGSKNPDDKWLNGWLDTQRAEIISQWDSMEQILRSDDDRFWNFIVTPEKLNDSSNSYFSRLEIIFDLQMGADKQKKDDINQQYRIYRFFENKVKDTKVSDKNQSISSVIWTETIKIFNIMREWYEDHELYHYIGYLSCIPIWYIDADNNSSDYPENFKKQFTSWLDVLTELVKYAKKHSKKDFSNLVKAIVRWTVLKQMLKYKVNTLNELLTKLTYDKKKDNEASPNQDDKNFIEDKDLIKCLLLLCNVQELILSTNMREADHKFPFKMLKVNIGTKLKLTLEHILPQNPEFTASNNQDKSLKDLKKIYQGFHDQLEKYGIKHEYQDYESDDPEDYKRRINILWDIANPPEQKVNGQRFYNLALLPHGTNAELSNHIFPEKRNKLLEATEKQYIPLSTQNVFLKRYSGRNKSNDQTKQEQKQESPLFWLESDAVAYRDAMAVLLSEFNLDKKDEEKGC